MNTHDRARLVILWRRVQRAKAIIDASDAEAMGILGRIQPAPSGASAIANLVGKSATPEALFHRPIVDVVAMSVTWRGNHCYLGYTRLLDLIDRLVRNPGRWVPYDRLLRDVWDDDMLGEGAIKVAVTRLKAKLVEHGMADLAKMICTSGYRCGYFPGGRHD